MAGWEQVLATLVVERGAALKRYAYLLCGDDATAEDLVQEALTRVLARPFGVRDPERIEGYVRAAIANLSADRGRGAARWRRLVPRLAVADDMPDPTTALDVRHDLRAALATLSPRQRACVVLRYYVDQPVALIAETLGCGEGTVKRHLSDAMARLAAHCDPGRAPAAESPKEGTWRSNPT